MKVFLDRLETDGNDDFLLLNELGPQFFGDEHLLEMLAVAKQRLNVFDQQQQKAMWCGLAAVAGAGLTPLSMLTSWPWLPLLPGLLSGAFGTAYLFIIFRLKNRFESRGELEYVLNTIQDELRRRTRQKTA